MLIILKTIRTLISYVLCGLLFIVPFSVLSLISLTGSMWAINSLYSIDVAICSMCHGTKLESISARCYRLRLDTRYYYQMLVVDWLSRPFDGANHCQRAYQWERKTIQGFRN